MWWRRRSPPARASGSAGWCSPARLQRKDIDAAFDVTDGKNVIRVTYRGILPDLFREGQGVVAEGTLIDAHLVPRRHRAGQARRELHAEGSGRRAEEAGSLEGRLRQEARSRGSAAGGAEMIAEIGHYALVLALALALIQATLADDRRAASAIAR